MMVDAGPEFVDFDKPVDMEPVLEAARRQLSETARANIIRRLIQERVTRKREALGLYLPLPEAQRFHESKSFIRLLTGSNRAGKTLTAASELARAVCGQHPWLPKRNGRAVCVGQSLEHIGSIMWAKLRSPGQFKIVPDEITGAWRAVRPDPLNPNNAIDPIDLLRKDQWRDAGPLIPRRFCDDERDIAWENKKGRIPRKVRIPATGWEIYFSTSNSPPRQGTEENYIWFDEEIDNDLWFGEMVARLMDRYESGVGMTWSATPQVATVQLSQLHEKCLAGDEGIEEFNLLIEQNPYISMEARKKLYDSMLSDTERRVRYYGEYAIAGLKVYPEFAPASFHAVDSFKIPMDWTRYIAIDPGSQIGACLFAAVPPEGTPIHFYRELYIQRCSATDMAQAIADVEGKHVFERIIFDMHAGRQTQMGDGVTVDEHYRRAMQEAGIECRHGGVRFTPGLDNTSAREEALRGMLKPDVEGAPQVVVHRGMVPNFEKEMAAQRYDKKIPDKRIGRENHLVDCAEYLAAARLRYRTPKMKFQDKSAVAELLAQKRRRIQRKERGADWSVTMGPPQ